MYVLPLMQAQADNNVQAQRFNFPGGVVEILIPKLSKALPDIKYGTRDPVVIAQQSTWRVLIGLDLRTPPGQYLLYVKHDDAEQAASSIKFEVKRRQHEPHDQTQTNHDDIRANEIKYSQYSELDFSNTGQPNLPLMPPVNGQWNNRFGYTSANSKKSSAKLTVQNFVTLTTTELSSVIAPQNAIVSRIIYNDKPATTATIFLDHGRGLYSIISGVSDLSIELGDGLVGGALIGRLVTNGADQPAELVWQCVLNGVYVDPFVLVNLLSSD